MFHCKFFILVFTALHRAALRSLVAVRYLSGLDGEKFNIEAKLAKSFTWHGKLSEEYHGV